MTRDEVVSLAQAYIDNQSKSFVWDKNNVLCKRDKSATNWATERVLDIAYEGPAELWDFILEVLHRTDDDEALGVLAAGPLEDYLAKCGNSVIERVEAQASADPKFRHLLGGVWKNTMPDDVWQRVCACRDDVW
jgi:hypothetical protein